MEEKTLRELYGIVTQYKKEEFPRVIGERPSYACLYHLSAIRENLISWLPVSKEMRVLERNAECGALTGRLLAMAGSVVSVTEDEGTAGLIRARYPGAGNRLDVLTESEWRAQGERRASGAAAREGFDLILIAGGASRYLQDAAGLRSLLGTEGRLVVADANRLGLKYLAGCQEEYRGGYFTGVEGYAQDASGREDTAARCYTRREYLSLLAEAGFADPRVYYPYPDHKFPAAVYSDDWLPKRGELLEHRRNFDRDRIQLFDEGRVYDTLIGEGLFGEFSNSFLIEAEKRED